MSDPTWAEAASQMVELVDRLTALQSSLADWTVGTESGGPDADGKFPFTQPDGTQILVPSPTAIARGGVNKSLFTPQICGGAKADAVQAADGTWSGTDDTAAIQAAIDAAFAAGGGSVWIPKGTYFIAGLGYIYAQEDKVRGVIDLKPGVSIFSDGAHLVMSGGRHNPPGIFSQNFYQYPRIDDWRISGVWLDGNGHNQTWDPALAGASGSSVYQFQHGIALLRGDNIEIDHCKFSDFRGDGAVIGNAFTHYIDEFLCRNARVHHCEFTGIYRESVLFCSVDGGSFDNNWVHGDGYLVAGLDIERHTANETVRGIEVSNNIFDFRDGNAPPERDGVWPTKYRRAVSIGFFYDGYVNNQVDGRAAGHRVHHNVVYQGMMDCWRHTDVEITDNQFFSTAEDLTGVRLVQSHGIQVFDTGGTIGLTGIKVARNTIRSNMPGNGVLAYNYNDVTVMENTIVGVGIPAVRLNYCSGKVALNSLEDCNTPAAREAAIIIDADQAGGVSVISNRVRDTRAGDARGINTAVSLRSAMTKAPLVVANEGLNLWAATGAAPVVTVDSAVGSFALIYGNTDGNGGGLIINNGIVVGDGTGSRDLRINGAVGGSKTVEFMTNSVQRVSMGISSDTGEPGDNSGSNFSAFVRDDNGAYLWNLLKVDRKTGNKDMSDGSFRISGTWDEPLLMGAFTRVWMEPISGAIYRKFDTPTGPTDGTMIGPYDPPDGTWHQPYVMAGVYVWCDPASGTLRRNFTVPESATDGRVIGPQPGGTWDFPLQIGGINFWGNPADGKFYCNGVTPTSATDGTVVGSQS